ncbi:MAG: SDR family oxidoreductase [Ignavibacteriae bacterium]|nr:SDR family oxidoreductase [Ignavibacteriota bacterium]NOG99208.1 SDR family oxidoreductase [Ignavibacteriota bacterium]
MKNNFENKVVLIIGATGGIGSAAAKRFDEEGSSVVLFSKNRGKLEDLGTSLNNESLIIEGDATSFEDLENAVNKTVEKFGRLDSLVHAVGSIVLKPLHNTDIETFKDVLDLNLTSPFLAIKASLKQMQKQKQGSVVVVSSVAGSKGLMNHEAISAAKGGLEAMIRSASVTYAKRGIRFNGVALGLVDTPLAKFLTQNEISKKASTSMHPMGRIGEPKDVTEAILYLASDNSAWVTGTILPIDGGMKAN